VAGRAVEVRIVPLHHSLPNASDAAVSRKHLSGLPGGSRAAAVERTQPRGHGRRQQPRASRGSSPPQRRAVGRRAAEDLRHPLECNEGKMATRSHPGPAPRLPADPRHQHETSARGLRPDPGLFEKHFSAECWVANCSSNWFSRV